MDELIRARMHEALDVEPLPAGLRQRVIATIPIHDRTVPWHWGRSLAWTGHWGTGLVAAFLAAALIASLLYSRSALNSQVGRQHLAPPTLVSPEGVAVGPDGMVYVSDYVENRVFELRPDGSLVSVAGGGVRSNGRASDANLFHPIGLAVAKNGDLYVAVGLGYSIERIDRKGDISTFATLDAPQGLAFDETGNLYVGLRYGDIVRLDVNGSRTTISTASLPPPATALGYLAFDSSGNLYIADRVPEPTGLYPNLNGGCRILRMSPDEKLSVIAGTGTCGYSGDGGPAAAAQLNDPRGIAFDSAGNLYFADANNHRIRRIDKNGIITTVAGSGVSGFSGDGGPAMLAQLAYPSGIGMAPGNRLYISDATCPCTNPIDPGRIRLFNISSGMITTVAGG